MKKVITILLALLMVLSFAACGGGQTTHTPGAQTTPTPEPQKTKAVQDLEANIYAIGEVGLESKAAIDEAEKQFCLLTDEERKMVENLEVLLLAEVAFDALQDSVLNEDLIIGTWILSQGRLVNDCTKLEIYEAGIAKYTSEYYSYAPAKWTIDTARQEALVERLENISEALLAG